MKSRSDKRQTKRKDFISRYAIVSKLARKSNSTSTRNKTRKDRLIYELNKVFRKAFSNIYNLIGCFSFVLVQIKLLSYTL